MRQGRVVYFLELCLISLIVFLVSYILETKSVAIKGYIWVVSQWLYNLGQKTSGHLLNFGRKVENLLYMLPSLHEQCMLQAPPPLPPPPPPKTMLKHASDQ